MSEIHVVQVNVGHRARHVLSVYPQKPVSGVARSEQNQAPKSLNRVFGSMLAHNEATIVRTYDKFEHHLFDKSAISTVLAQKNAPLCGTLSSFDETLRQMPKCFYPTAIGPSGQVLGPSSVYVRTHGKVGCVTCLRTTWTVCGGRRRDGAPGGCTRSA